MANRAQFYRQKRSRVWDFFAAPVGGRVRCRVCGAALTFHNSTSSLREHVRRRHGVRADRYRAA